MRRAVGMREKMARVAALVIGVRVPTLTPPAASTQIGVRVRTLTPAGECTNPQYGGAGSSGKAAHIAAMPRRVRFLPAEIPGHVIQRGNNRTTVFRERQDYMRYRAVLDHARRRTGCAIHAYVLMTNHVHLLVTPHCATGVSEMMQIVGRRYVRYFNDRYHRTGSLWEGRFRSTPIDSERYFFTCARYIELNPVRAGIARHPGEYAWSSFRANAEEVSDSLVATHPLYDSLGSSVKARASAYAALFAMPEDDEAMNTIRRATNTGLPLLKKLGSESGT
jgi:putative transposase